MQRGQNYLLEAAYRDLGRAAFRAELIFTVLCLAGVVLIGWLA